MAALCRPRASVSVEGPKGCLSSLLSHSKQPSHFQRKPKSCSKSTCNNNHLAASSESAPDLTRPGHKPSSLRSTKKPFFLPRWQSSKKPASKASQRLKISAGVSNSLRNPACGFERYEVNQTEGQGVVVDDKPLVGEDSNSANINIKATTPPVEVSVSPEIQGGSHFAAVAASTVTPVCYGAGHLISEVTDKRKCRSRGILTVRCPTDSTGFEKSTSCGDDVNKSAENILFKSRNSLIPLPAEALVNWLSSPLGKEGEVQKGASFDSSRTIEFAPICTPSLSSSFCKFSSYLLSDSGEKKGDSDAMGSTGKSRIALLSPRRVSTFQGLLEFSSEKNDIDFSATPQAKSNCGTVCLPEEGSYSLIGNSDSVSIDNLSCSNVVQTPISNTSSESRVCLSWIDVHRNQFSPDQGNVEPDSQMASLSPKAQMSMWGPPVLDPQLAKLASPSHSTDAIKLERKLDGCASWNSDSTLENISLSQMRISWREGLSSQTFDMDEFDCCRCVCVCPMKKTMMKDQVNSSTNHCTLLE